MGTKDEKELQNQEQESNQFVTKEEFKQLQEQITGVQIKAKNQSRSLEEKLNIQGDNIGKILEALSSSGTSTQDAGSQYEATDIQSEDKLGEDDLGAKIDLLRQNQQKALEQQNQQILTLQQQLEESRKQAELTKKEAIAARQKASWLTAAKDLAVNPDMMYELAKIQGAIASETEEIVVNTGKYDVNADEICVSGPEAVKHLLSLPQYSNFAVSVKSKTGSGFIPGSGQTPKSKVPEQVTLKDEMSKVFGGLNL